MLSIDSKNVKNTIFNIFNFNTKKYIRGCIFPYFFIDMWSVEYDSKI